MEENNSFESQLQQSLMINGALAAMPQLINLYPQIQGLPDMIQKGIEDYLGDNEKMIVLTRKNGVTRAIVLDAKVPFTLTNEMKLEAQTTPVKANYELQEYKQKLLDSVIFQTLKEKYEKQNPQDQQSDQPNSIMNLLSAVK